MRTKRTQIREILSLVLIALCVAVIVQQVVSGNRSKDQASQPLKPSANSPLVNYEQDSFTVIAKFSFTISEFLHRKAKTSGEYQQIRLSFIQGFSSVLEQTPGHHPLTEERLLLSQALELKNSTTIICEELSDSEQYTPYCSNEGIRNSDGALRKLIDPWFELLRKSLIFNDKESHAQAYAQGRSTVVNILTFSTIGILVFAVSCYLLCSILSKALSGKLTFRFTPTPEIRPELIETFALYISAMLFLPELVDYFPSVKNTEGMLFYNVAGISSLSVLYFWSRMRNKEATQSCFGLSRISFKKLLLDIGSGPLCYVAFLSGLFVVILFYSMLLQFLGVDPSSGSHPIIPLLAKDKSGNIWILAALVAVIVAPIVEELFFRGALYGWLRTRLGAASSIMISAMIFAVIHPQGALGLVPLTCIGMMLAFAREWRNSLITPILAHACVNGVTLLLARTIM